MAKVVEMTKKSFQIHVQGAQAKRTVVARGISEGENLLATVLAYKAIVVFCESFVFHIVTFGMILPSRG